MTDKTSSIYLSKRILLGVGVLVVISVLFLAYYFYKQNKRAKLILQDPGQIAKEEIASLVSKVEKLMILPTGETPTFATVTDWEKLKDEIFFKNAKKGDKVLIYTKAKKAILYRPSTNKIMEVSEIADEQSTQGAKP